MENEKEREGKERRRRRKKIRIVRSPGSVSEITFYARKVWGELVNFE